MAFPDGLSERMRTELNSLVFKFLWYGKRDLLSASGGLPAQFFLVHPSFVGISRNVWLALHSSMGSSIRL